MTLYDEVPYPDHAWSHAHPDRLHALALLSGLSPPPVETATIVELGCGAGGHLLPIAHQLPRARVLGIDLAAAAIARGSETARALGLSNLTLTVGDLTTAELPPSIDYLICHGVYAWVPPAARAAILARAAAHLSPHGVLYLSWDARPGAHVRGLARQVFGQLSGAPLERARAGKALLAEMARLVGREGSPHAVLLRHTADRLSGRDDGYLVHDLMCEDYTAFLLQEVAQDAAAHGLGYLADADVGLHLLADLTPDGRARIDRLPDDPVVRGQYGDLLRGTAFRRSLFSVRSPPPPGGTPAPPLRWTPAAMDPLRVTLTGRPDAGGFAVTDDGPLTVRAGERAVTLTAPIAKAAVLSLLLDPRPPTVEALRASAAARVGAPDDDLVRATLLDLWSAGAVDLVARDRGEATEVSARPVADPLARHLAPTAPLVPNRRHEMTPLSRLDQALLPRLDGTRDAAALLEALVADVEAGALTVKIGGRPSRDPAAIRAALQDALAERVVHLQRVGLLIG